MVKGSECVHCELATIADQMRTQGGLCYPHADIQNLLIAMADSEDPWNSEAFRQLVKLATTCGIAWTLVATRPTDNQA